MPLQTVYIETTIPSFYYEVRTEPDMVARRQWTREWWDEYRPGYDVVSSDAVVDELERGNHPVKDEALLLVDGLELLPIEAEIGEIVEAYIRQYTDLGLYGAGSAREAKVVQPAGEIHHLIADRVQP